MTESKSLKKEDVLKVLELDDQFGVQGYVVDARITEDARLVV